MRKQKLTFEDHVRLGAELAAMRDRLVDIDLKLNNAYPFASKQALAAHRSYAKIDKMRWALESAMFKDFPEQAKFSVYFPNATQGKK